MNRRSFYFRNKNILPKNPFLTSNVPRREEERQQTGEPSGVQYGCAQQNAIVTIGKSFL